MTPWLSVIIPTIGRHSLADTLTSLRLQPESEGVEVLVVADTYQVAGAQFDYVHKHVEDLGFAWLEHDAGLHCVGQPQRTFGSKVAAAPWIWFCQDDNIAAVDSLVAIELAIEEQPHPRPLFLRTRAYWGDIIWRAEALALGNIDADCLVLPREIARRVEWGLRYEGDYDAALQAQELSGGDVAWIDQVVSVARPATEQLWWR